MKFYRPRIKVLVPMDSDSPTIYFCHGLGWTGCGDDATEAYNHWVLSLSNESWSKLIFLKINIKLIKFMKTLEL